GRRRRRRVVQTLPRGGPPQSDTDGAHTGVTRWRWLTKPVPHGHDPPSRERSTQTHRGEKSAKTLAWTSPPLEGTHGRVPAARHCDANALLRDALCAATRGQRRGAPVAVGESPCVPARCVHNPGLHVVGRTEAASVRKHTAHDCHRLLRIRDWSRRQPQEWSKDQRLHTRELCTFSSVTPAPAA